MWHGAFYVPDILSVALHFNSSRLVQVFDVIISNWFSLESVPTFSWNFWREQSHSNSVAKTQPLFPSVEQKHKGRVLGEVEEELLLLCQAKGTTPG